MHSHTRRPARPGSTPDSAASPGASGTDASGRPGRRAPVPDDRPEGGPDAGPARAALTRFFRLPCSQAGLLAGLLLFIVGTPPFLYGWLSTPADRIYTGLMFDVPDHAQYWTWVTQSRDGLFIANTMTPEPNPPIFLNPMMWTLARVRELTGLSFPGLFQWWRLLACLVLGVALVKGFRVFAPVPRERAAAYVMAVAGAGLGWVLVLAKYAGGLPDVPFPLDLYTVEPNTFFASFAYPYLALAQGLVLLTFLGAWLVHRDGHPQGYILGVGAAVALALTHAYDLITIYAVLGTFWLVEVLRTRRLPVRLTLAGLAIGLASGPIAVYYRNLTAGDPLWTAILAQYANAGVWTPAHAHLIVLMGLPLLLAAWALPAVISRTRAGAAGPDLFVAVWAMVGVGLIYLPVVYQIKLLTAWQFPLAFLAAQAWQRQVVPRLAGGRLAVRPGPALAVLALLVLPTNLYLYAWRFAELGRHDTPYYLHRDEAAALDWLAAHTSTDDLVLAPLEIGQFVPNYGRTRAFLAHWAMTNRFFQRRDEAARFFTGATPDDYRRVLLDREGVTLVLALRPEQPAPAGASFDPSSSPLFDPVFSTDRAAIFRYRAAVARQGGIEGRSQ